MERLEKFYRLHCFMSDRRHPASLLAIQEALECSRATANRVIRDLRLYFQAPIIYDRNRGGYRYDLRTGESFELPGLWFSQEELLALLGVQRLLNDVQPGLLEEKLQPLRARIEKILASSHRDAGELLARIRILKMAARSSPAESFQTVASALAERKRLSIAYSSRGKGEGSLREISPQRLVRYRDNWYLDAFCHLREELRSFSLDRISAPRKLDKCCQEIADEALDAHFAGSYGIFAGIPEHTAVLKFTPERARWVADEEWHPKQQSRYLSDGSFELSLPYSDSRELVMDILKYGPDVEVLAPDELRQAVKEKLTKAMKIY